MKDERTIRWRPYESAHGDTAGGGASGNDDGVRTYEDYDGILDTDGCHDSPGDDTDGDLFSDEREFQIGTNPARACAASSAAEDESPDPYPLDFNDDGSVTGFDLSQIAAVIGQAVPPAPARRDLNVDGAVTGADLSLVAARIGTACLSWACRGASRRARWASAGLRRAQPEIDRELVDRLWPRVL